MKRVVMMLAVLLLVGCSSPHQLVPSQQISRQQAIQAASRQVGDLKVREATFVESYPIDGKGVPVWRVQFQEQGQQQPQATYFVDALTGEVVWVENPPGQGAREEPQMVVGGKPEQYAVWMVEAVHFDGERLVVYVEAGQYPPRVLDVERYPGYYVGRDQAVQAALEGTQNATLKEARFVARYYPDHPGLRAKGLAVWAIELVSRSDQRPAARVIVDAVTGKVLSAVGPPTGLNPAGGRRASGSVPSPIRR